LGEVGGFRGRSCWQGTVKGRRMEVGDAARHAGAEQAVGGDNRRFGQLWWRGLKKLHSGGGSGWKKQSREEEVAWPRPILTSMQASVP
jgi:hypothetical protein